MRNAIRLGCCFLLLLALACKKKTEETVIPTPNPPVPKDTIGFPAPLYDFASNPLDEKKFRLGRMLFYDPILSRDSCISCNTCHQQARAFTSTAGHVFSHGIDSLSGTRNASGLINLAWSPFFMWDGSIINLELQALAPMQNKVEMDEKLPTILSKLNRHPLYRPRFKEAFGGDSINSQQLLKALAQFTVQIVSNNSNYDKYKKGQYTFNQDQVDGLALTQKYCTSCHVEPLFTDNVIRNIGLDSSVFMDLGDKGRELVTHLPRDQYKFKTPTLRNADLTKPYFHDGRASDMQVAIRMHGEVASSNLDPNMIVDGKRGFPLDPEQRRKIYEFIKTLTDTELLTNNRFSLQASDFAPYSITKPTRCNYAH